MAELVFTDAFVSIDGNDISDHVTSVTIDYSADMQEKTAMGDDTHSNIGGLKNWSMSVDVNNDYAAGNIDALMFPLIGSTVTVIVRPVKSTVVGATNPNYTGSAVVESYPPVTAAIGELATASISLQPAGTLSRAVA